MALGAGVEVLQVHRLLGAVQAREFADGVSGHGGDGSGPLGSLLQAVFAFAHDVGAPLLEALLVDPLVDKLVVDHILLEEHLGHGEHHGQVSAGADRNPLVGENLGRLGVARVDDDGLQTVLVGQLHVVGRRAEPGDHRVHAPHDEELGVEQVGSLEARQGVLQAAGDLGEINSEVQHLAGGVSRGGMLAPGAEARLPPGSQREAVLLEAGILGMEDAVGTVLPLDFLHLLGVVSSASSQEIWTK